MKDDEKIEPVPDIEGLAGDLVKKSLRILDPTQKAAYACEKLAKLDAPVIVEILHIILCNAAKRLSGYREFAERGINSTMLAQKLGSFKLSRVYHFAKKHEYLDIVSLFSTTSPIRISNGDENLFLVYGASDQTVGHRKSMARSHDKTVLDKIGYDPNPMVIRQLLVNPRITEEDVVKIAARRPNHANVLTEIFKNKKWLASYKIKHSIAANPYTPIGISRQIIPFLLQGDLKELEQNGSVADELKTEARRIYEIKKNPNTVFIPVIEEKPDDIPVKEKQVYDLKD